ncbi:hypothetical protein BC835DRAFT_1462271 [Cytidiella melzeri]|nr:hypothetical protein BC835DRAFT_1462271 [Cytidiella melzeri]
MINNFALGLRVLGPTAVDFSIDQILATGQRMGSFGFPIEVSSQSVPPPPPAPANPPANASAEQGASTPAARDKGKGKIVVPGTHPASDTKPDARANLVREPKPKAPVVHAPRPPESKTTVVITFHQSADEGSIRKEEEVRAIVARLYHSWQLAEHGRKGGATTTLQPKLNPVIRVKWDEKRRNQLQLAFQVRPELSFVNWLEDVWTKMTTEDLAGYPLSSSYPPVLLVHMYTSMAELVIQACPSKDLSIQDIFAEMSRNNPEVFQHLVPSNYTPVAFWGAGHRKGSPGPLHIFAYDVGGEVTQRLIQERVTIGSKKCSLVLAQSTARVAMCTHCHRIGHWRDQCKNGAFEWCKVCPANHRTEDHNEVAPCCIPTRERLQTETWPCPNEHWICANCGKTGHGHYSNRCSRYSKRGDKAYMQGVDPATQLRRDVPAVPCKAGRQLDNNATKSANCAIRTQKKRAEEAAAALIAAKDHEGNVPMRESTPVAGPSTQRKRVKSGRTPSPIQAEPLTPIHRESQVSPTYSRDQSPDFWSGAPEYRTAYEARMSSFDYVREDEFLENPSHAASHHASTPSEGNTCYVPDDLFPNLAAWRGRSGYNSEQTTPSPNVTPVKRVMHAPAMLNARDISPDDIVEYDATFWEAEEGYGRSPLLLTHLTPDTLSVSDANEETPLTLDNVPVGGDSPTEPSELSLSSVQLTPQLTGSFAGRLQMPRESHAVDDAWNLPSLRMYTPTPSIVQVWTHAHRLGKHHGNLIKKNYVRKFMRNL